MWRWCRQTGVLGLWGRGPARLSRLRRMNTGEVALVYDNDPDTRPPQQSAWTEAMLRVPGGPQASVGLPLGERVSVRQVEGSSLHRDTLSEGSNLHS